MAYQMTLTLSNEEYAALARDAEQRGVPIEAVIHELIASRASTPPPSPSTISSRQFLEKLYREGKVASLPTYQPLASDEETARERLAQRLAGGMTAAEMAIEDRGPR